MERALLWEVSLPEFLLVTAVLGGGAAWLSGRALARTWQPAWHAALWMLLLAAAVRFIHYALFRGTLLSGHYYLVDLAVLLALAMLGYRRTRTRQMARQYGWLFRPHGPFGWRRREAVPEPPPASS